MIFDNSSHLKGVKGTSDIEKLILRVSDSTGFTEIQKIIINDCLFLILLLRIAIYSQCQQCLLTMRNILLKHNHTVNKHVNKINKNDD